MKTKTDVTAGALAALSRVGGSIVIAPHIVLNLAILVQIGRGISGSIVQIGH
jgi:hypothetical protein